MTGAAGEDVLEKAYEVLSRYPLCEYCLGRLFAGYLRGFSNKERGSAIKTTLLMNLIAKNDIHRIKNLLGKLEEKYRKTIEELGLNWINKENCIICGDLIEKWESLYKEAIEKLIEVRADSFVVGVKTPREILRTEDTVWREHLIKTAESIASELRREVGKRIRDYLGIEPEFSEPGVIVLINISEGRIDLIINPILIKGLYLKLGRRISQSKWVSPEGERYYDLSIEDMIERVNEYFKGDKVVLHASGREDTDARMLGTGRPMIIEVKNPRTRRVPLELLEYILNYKNKWGKFKLLGKARRADVRVIKEFGAYKRKVYKALVVLEEEVNENNLRRLEGVFRNAIIKQRTPSRVVHRRADIVRIKRVFEIKTIKLASNVFEAIISAEGGLYIKELVNGDGGRTTPSFSEVLGVNAECVELDVLSVEL